MELPGKNILHDSLCGKYLFLSVCERGLSCLVHFSTVKQKPQNLYREKNTVEIEAAGTHKPIHVHTHMCIYTYVHIYTHFHIHTRIHTHMYIHICTYTYIYTYAYIYTHFHIQFTYMHIGTAHICIHMHAHVYIYAYVRCICTHRHTFSHMNIHTCTSTYTHIHVYPIGSFLSSSLCANVCMYLKSYTLNGLCILCLF